MFSFAIVADILERRLSDGGVEFSDSRPSYATQPGQVRVQRKLWVSPALSIAAVQTLPINSFLLDIIIILSSDV